MGESRGRPYSFAVLPDETSRIAVLERFFDVIGDLNNAEIMGLARALYRSHWTIRTHWKTRRSNPPYDVMLRVISWDKQGRVLEKRKVTQSYVDLF